ncbi:MFS transporter [Rhodococcoides yunnanense]|uniref:MFS transporter n=1 Tax=Rhodococcoides yunnanense TaxID=278209 RepID=UPI000B308BC9|nr:MFS transporter [Rhodococcus yunnanensis]
MSTVRNSRTTTALIAAVAGLSVANIYYAQPLIEAIGTSMSMEPSQLGLIVGTSQLGYLLGLVVVVPLSDLVERRRFIAVLILGAATGTVIVASSADTAMLLVGLAVTGLFSVVVQVLVAYASALSEPGNRGRTIGTVTSGVVVGIILARTVSGSIADTAGWRAVYAGSAVVTTVTACLLLPRLPATAVMRGSRTYRQALGSVVGLTRSNRVFRTRALITLFMFASFGTLWSGMALPLSEDPWNLSVTSIGAFGVAGLIGALGAKRAGLWADEGLGERVTVAALIVLVSAWAAISATAESLVLLAVGVVLLDFAVQAVHVTSQNLLVRDDPESSGSIIGSYMVFYSLGSALGAFGASALFEMFGWPGVCISGAAYAIAALAVWSADREATRRSARLGSCEPTSRPDSRDL